MINNNIVYSVTEFILQEDCSNKDNFYLFNKWSAKVGNPLHNYEDAILIINHIKSVINSDRETMAQAQIIDKKNIRKNIFKRVGVEEI